MTNMPLDTIRLPCLLVSRTFPWKRKLLAPGVETLLIRRIIVGWYWSIDKVQPKQKTRFSFIFFPKALETNI